MDVERRQAIADGEIMTLAEVKEILRTNSISIWKDNNQLYVSLEMLKAVEEAERRIVTLANAIADKLERGELK